MKIKYREIAIPMESDLKSVLNNIKDELILNGYEIEEEDSDKIKFSYNYWGFGLQFEVFQRVDGGIFFFDDLKKEKLTLIYYISPIFEMLALFITLTLSMIYNHKLLFFSCFIVVMFFIRLMSVRHNGYELVRKICARQNRL